MTDLVLLLVYISHADLTLGLFRLLLLQDRKQLLILLPAESIENLHGCVARRHHGPLRLRLLLALQCHFVYQCGSCMSCDTHWWGSLQVKGRGASYHDIDNELSASEKLPR